MSEQRGLSVVIGAWVYGVICGLGMAVSTVGYLRGEPLQGVIWPALTPLLLAPLLILKLTSKRRLSA